MYAVQCSGRKRAVEAVEAVEAQEQDHNRRASLVDCDGGVAWLLGEIQISMRTGLCVVVWCVAWCVECRSENARPSWLCRQTSNRSLLVLEF